MEKSPSWEANGSLAGQEMYHILWNLKFHKHKCLQLSLSQARWFKSNSPILLQFYTPTYVKDLRLVSFPQISPLKFCMYVTWCAQVIILDLITPVIFGKEYKSRSSSLCSFLQSPVTLILLWMNNFQLSNYIRWEDLCGQETSPSLSVQLFGKFMFMIT